MVLFKTLHILGIQMSIYPFHCLGKRREGIFRVL